MRLVSQVMMKSLISLVIANWFATLLKRYPQESNGLSYRRSFERNLRRLRPGEPKTAESSRSLLVARFFDPRRYDLAAVGRYKINKKTQC